MKLSSAVNQATRGRRENVLRTSAPRPQTNEATPDLLV
jgi:hypothetical protein